MIQASARTTSHEGLDAAPGARAQRVVEARSAEADAPERRSRREPCVSTVSEIRVSVRDLNVPILNEVKEVSNK
jgi:hypothetical protein